MEDLNLPIIKMEAHKERHLSMDDYLRFVVDNLKYSTDINIGRALKKKTFVDVPFYLS
ncbi:MAG: hypothetical protein KJ893_11405 [Candidatus Omnitrophica bacterium]|nr:hypothetical protein [Candidatus Omnitrophota bacterium]MBU4477787.1 hypothetical protein [Candidatus Omnitrophota bacterium]MCG2704102.1 hypothetical protein [Candidatus Omnitrophota bacterium]